MSFSRALDKITMGMAQHPVEPAVLVAGLLPPFPTVFVVVLGDVGLAAALAEDALP
jgi:hypothetical protein